MHLLKSELAHHSAHLSRSCTKETDGLADWRAPVLLHPPRARGRGRGRGRAGGQEGGRVAGRAEALASLH